MKTTTQEMKGKIAVLEPGGTARYLTKKEHKRLENYLEKPLLPIIMKSMNKYLSRLEATKLKSVAPPQPKKECMCSWVENGEYSGHSICGFPCPVHPTEAKEDWEPKYKNTVKWFESFFDSLPLAHKTAINDYLVMRIKKAQAQAVRRTVERIEKDFESIGYFPEEGDCFKCFTRTRWDKLKKELEKK